MTGRSARRSPALLLTCEHATAAVPAALRPLFAGAGASAALASHRGSDHGALAVARRLARRSGATLIAGRVSRLVVDLNRSETHPRVLSEWTRELPAEQREELLQRFHRSHRAEVDRSLGVAGVGRRHVVHLGVHSFSGDLPGDRDFQVGLLYDPRRTRERALARHLLGSLRLAVPGLRALANRPYLGTSDGLTTRLREVHPDERYAGLELELHQGWLAAARSGDERRRLTTLIEVLGALLTEAEAPRGPSARH